MRTTLTVLAVLLALIGCASEAPIAQTHPISQQRKVKSAHHWDVIASDVAAEAKAALAKEALESRAVYVTPPSASSAFNSGFHGFLITQLVRQGVNVSEKPGNALEIRFETQVVRHASPRNADIQGSWTGLIAGILVARNVRTWSAFERGIGALGVAAAADLTAGYSTSATQTELLVTTSLTADGRYRLRKSDVYYIEDEDGVLFRQAKEWKVTGS